MRLCLSLSKSLLDGCRPDKKSRGDRIQLRIEPLEGRQMLAADPIITEFMASNNETLADGDGNFSDWIEIFNAGDTAIDLEGYFLSDDSADLGRWTFPSVTLEAGNFLTVFASGQPTENYVDAGGFLHTNFRLNADGDYLALVRPDLTIASEFGPGGTDFPDQRSDVSYGITNEVIETTLLGSGSSAKTLIPASPADLPGDWTDPAFVDAAWPDAVSGIGYDFSETGGGEPVGESTNIAPLGLVSQSSTSFGFGADLAINENTGDFTHTSSGDPAPTWQADFGIDVQLEQIVLYNRGGGCCPERLRDITVSVLDSSQTEVFNSGLLNPENVLGGPATLTVDLAPDFLGQTVKVTRLRDDDFSGAGATPDNPDDASVLSLGEVEIFGRVPVGLTQNLALGQPTSQSSTNSSFASALGVDGNLANFTHTSGADPSPSWQVDLGAAASISKIVVNNRGDGCCGSRLRDIVVEVLAADSETVVWTSDLLNPENQAFSFPNGPGNITLDLDAIQGAPAFGQFVRVSRIVDPDLSGTAGQGNADEAAVLSLGEVQVFGSLVPQYFPFIQTDLIDEMKDVNATALLRIPFDVADPAAIDLLSLSMRYDDGFVAYLNGVEVARRNAPAALLWNATATAEHLDDEAVVPEQINLSQFVSLLTPTDNVLAIQGLNLTAGDEDFLIDAELVATNVLEGEARYMTVPTPGQINGDGFLGFVSDTAFDVNRGFFESPFDVTITSATPGATVIYTTDGSEPSPDNGTQVAAADENTTPVAVVNITGTTALRAAAFREGFKPTNVDTNTYIFLDQVLAQDGAGFPSTWAGGFPADYTLDPNVLLDPAYRDTIKDDLRSIPTMSIVMSNDDMFGASRGIYSNSTGRGSEWERGASIELIDTDGSTLFQENAGVRMFGFGFRPHASTPKHSFRLLFKEKYGAKKLNYPLFGEGTVDNLDNIVLRSQGNASYGDFRPGSRANTSYLQDAWARKTQAAMGEPTAGTTFVHLYVNGLYWGLYNPTERPDGKFMAERYGGTEEDYDALNARVGNIEAQNGDRQAWDTLIGLVNQDVTQESVYSQVQDYLDIDNFINYLLINMYGGNTDWPGSNGNNLRVARKRDGSMGFLSFVWDTEWMFESLSQNSTSLSTNSPTHGLIHTRLMNNPDYRQRFNDLVQENFFNDGPLTPAKVSERYMGLADQIDRAIVGESARWGDVRREPPYTRDFGADNWVQVRDNLVNNYFPQRTQVVLNQMAARGWLTDVSAPQYLINNLPQNGGGVIAGDQLSVQIPDEISYINNPSVQAGDLAAVLVPSAGDDGLIGTTWTETTFVPGAAGETPWTSGQTGIGYENNTTGSPNYVDQIKTDIGNELVALGQTSVYVRVEFSHDGVTDDFDRLALRMKYDDGFVAYLNGTEVARGNVSGAIGTAPAYNAAAAGNHPDPEALTFQDFDITDFKNLLISGTNVLAIQAMNLSTTSSDMLIVPELVEQVVDTNSVSTPIWFTTDGSDPRLPGGAVGDTAILFSGPIPLAESTQVKARTLDAGTWSALSEALFTVAAPLRVSELMYNPDGDDAAEFIELVNTSAVAFPIAGVRFDGTLQGIEFTFDAGEAELAPGERIVVVRNQAAFAAVHDTTGLRIATGQYDDGGTALANGGEMITLTDAAGGVIQQFTYDDDWYKETDGDGFSLVVVRTDGDYNDSANWRSSGLIGGSPSLIDPMPAPGDFDGDGLTGRTDIVRLLSQFGRTTNAHRGRGDFNLDGATGLLDTAGLQASLGSIAASASPAPDSAAAAALVEQIEVIHHTSSQLTSRAAQHRRRIARPNNLEATDQALAEWVGDRQADRASQNARSLRARRHQIVAGAEAENFRKRVLQGI